MRLLLIRHAEVTYNDREGPSADITLSQRGYFQAKQLATYLLKSRELDGIDEFFCSPLVRTRETAQQISEIARVPKFKIIDSLTGIGAPSTENLSEGLDRVHRTLEQFARVHDSKSKILVTHAGFIVGTILKLFKIPIGIDRARLEPDFASITEWSLVNDQWTLVRYNVKLVNAWINHISKTLR